MSAPIIKRSISLGYENDFSGQTDEYYTQGIALTVTHPELGSFPIYKLLRLSNKSAIYSASVIHLGYTPQSITDPTIRYGDRPYAATLQVRLSAIAFDSIHKSTLKTGLISGIIGRAAGGEWMQRTIHERTGNALPEGWQYQIRNDVVIAYEIEYTRSLLNVNRFFMVEATGAATAGSFQTRATAGVTIQAGYLPAYPYSGYRKCYGYLYYTVLGNAVGYDASMQGGIFNRSSPYTINATDITRFTLLQQFGIRAMFGRTGISVYNSYLSKEFNSGSSHSYSGITLSAGI